jgi:hypothetical protein
MYVCMYVCVCGCAVLPSLILRTRSSFFSITQNNNKDRPSSYQYCHTYECKECYTETYLVPSQVPLEAYTDDERDDQTIKPKHNNTNE